MLHDKKIYVLEDNSKDPKHGNVCRNTKNGHFKCPKGCIKKKKAPFCQKSKEAKV